MKKFSACLFIVLLLMALAVPVAADDLKADLVQFITETNELKPDEFTIGELQRIELEHLDLNLISMSWFSDQHRGQVALVVETQEFLTDAELWTLMNENWEMQVQEQVKLQQQAGKMDVWLYQRLVDGKANDVVEIYITPVFRLSEELEAQIRALYAEYDLEAPQDLGIWGQSSDGYVGVDFGETSQSGEQGRAIGGYIPSDSGRDEPTPGKNIIEPSPPTTTPLPADRAPDYVDGDTPVGDKYRPELEEFYAQLAELYAQGAQESIAVLTAHLDSLGAEYEVSDTGILATVTAAKALELREHQDIAWISNISDVGVDLAPMPIVGTADGREPAMGNRQGEMADTQFTAMPEGSSRKPWVWGVGIIGLIGAATLLIVRRF